MTNDAQPALIPDSYRLPLSPAMRLAGFYAAIFGTIGILLPFWPVWLKSRGMSAGEIGILISVGMWIKVAATPIAASVADRIGERRRPLIVLAAGTFLAYGLYYFAADFWSLLAVSILVGMFYSPIMALGENLSLLTIQTARLDYGRVRSWGSVAFILASLAAGWLLRDRSDTALLSAIVAAFGVIVVACLLLPDTRPRATPGSKAPMLRLLANRTFTTFLVVAGLIQGSHAVLYGFATLHWRDAGLSGLQIGFLWSEGVVAEILMFAVGAKLIAWLGPLRLIALAAAIGIVRWIGTALFDQFAALIVLQALHGATFGATHLGSMAFLSRAVSPAISAGAMSLYSAIGMGIVFGLSMLAAGSLYGQFGAAAWFASATMCGVAGITALIIARKWTGAEIL